MNAPAPNCRADPTPAVRPSLAPTLAAGAGPRPSLPPPTMSLRALLDQAGSAVLAGLPARAWVEASITAVRPGAHGHAMELADAGRGGAADPAQLRAFLARDALKAIGRESGAPFDPTLLTGMTVCLLLAPSFSARWHLSARILGLSAETRDSLARRAVDQFRRELRASGHYDRQRALPGPPDVIRVAIVTPSGAAGHADIAVELERWQAAGLVRLTTHTAPFEGERAPAALVAALTAAAVPLDGFRPDLILLVRGGGASASLQALNHEAIVRAICTCPVPVVAGLGHAVDRTLVDEVAWRTADTPSKALALVARLISQPAAQARAAVETIGRAARTILTLQADGLDRTRAEIVALARRGTEGAEAETATVAASLGGAEARLQDGLARSSSDLDRLWRDCIGDGDTALTGCATVLQRSLSGIIAEAERCLAGADDGTASFAAVTRAISARVATATSGCDALWRDIVARTGDHLTTTHADLTTHASTIATTDVPSMLSRGYAIVTDPSGQIVRTPAAARTAERVTIMLASGSVTAVVEPIPPAKPAGDHA